MVQNCPPRRFLALLLLGLALWLSTFPPVRRYLAGLVGQNPPRQGAEGEPAAPGTHGRG